MKKITKKIAMKCEQRLFDNLSEKEQNDYIISKYNFAERGRKNCPVLIEHIHIGDICYFDFGCAYRFEIGYQHPGLVLAKSKQKLLVVPLISAKKDYKDSPVRTLVSKSTTKLNKDSVALLNDMKWISGMRTINYIGHIDVSNYIFNEIRQKTINLLFSVE